MLISLILISINDILLITIEIDRHFHFNKRLRCHRWRVAIVSTGVSPGTQIQIIAFSFPTKFQWISQNLCGK